MIDVLIYLLTVQYTVLIFLIMLKYTGETYLLNTWFGWFCWVVPFGFIFLTFERLFKWINTRN